MRDFNFFEPYIGKTEKYKVDQVGKYVAIGVIASLMILYPAFNQWQIHRALKETAEVSLIAQSAEIQQGKRTIEELEEELHQLEANHQQLLELKNRFNEINIINDYLIYTINDLLPEEIFLQALKIQADQINLQGIAKTKVSIAVFESNLSQVDSFDKIFIPNIVESNGSYTFTLSIDIKGGVEE